MRTSLAGEGEVARHGSNGTAELEALVGSEQTAGQEWQDRRPAGLRPGSEAPQISYLIIYNSDYYCKQYSDLGILAIFCVSAAFSKNLTTRTPGISREQSGRGQASFCYPIYLLSNPDSWNT
jgi:hypothetical protein